MHIQVSHTNILIHSLVYTSSEFISDTQINFQYTTVYKFSQFEQYCTVLVAQMQCITCLHSNVYAKHICICILQLCLDAFALVNTFASACERKHCKYHFLLRFVYKHFEFPSIALTDL